MGGGATVGVLAGVMGRLLVSPTSAVHVALWIGVALVALLYEGRELRGWPLPVPTRHWQVPKHWGQYGEPFYAAAFGVILGAGFFTFVTFIGDYLLLLLCFLFANPLQGGMLMAAFGLARAAPILLAPLICWLRRSPYSFEAASALNYRLKVIDPQMAWLRAGALFAVAGSALATGLLRL